MKQNVSKTKSNWRFQKYVKTCLKNKKLAWPFLSNLNFACKDGRHHSNMQTLLSFGCKPYHYQLLQRALS